MLLALEEMQSHLRAENGIKERIVGYVGSDWEPELEEVDFTEMGEEFKQTDFSDLPEYIRDVVDAENHRIKTNELLTVDQYKERIKNG